MVERGRKLCRKGPHLLLLLIRSMVGWWFAGLFGELSGSNLSIISNSPISLLYCKSLKKPLDSTDVFMDIFVALFISLIWLWLLMILIRLFLRVQHQFEARWALLPGVKLGAKPQIMVVESYCRCRWPTLRRCFQLQRWPHTAVTQGLPLLPYFLICCLPSFLQKTFFTPSIIVLVILLESDDNIDEQIL